MNIQIINQEQALQYVKDAISQETCPRVRDPKEWNLKTEFNYNLDLTSLDLAEMTIYLEKQTKLDLDSKLEDLVTIGDMCNLIQKRAAFAAIKTLLEKEVLDEASVTYLKPWTNLQTDLGMDSIEVYDLYALIEENFKIVFPPKTKEMTVSKLCDLIVHCQNSKTNNIWKHVAIKKQRKKTRKFAAREHVLPKIKDVMFQEGMISLDTQINFDTNLEKDLRLDYLDKLNLNCQLSKSFDISLPDNADSNTVGEVCDNVIKYSKLESIVRNISPYVIQMLADTVAKKELSADNVKPESYMRKIFSKRDILLEQDLFAKRIKEKYHVDIFDKLSQIKTPKELCFYIAEQMVINHKNTKKQTTVPANAFQNASYHIVQDLGPVMLKKNWIQEPVSLVSEIEIKTTSDYFALARIIKKKYNVGFINNVETMQDLSEQIIKSRVEQFRKTRNLKDSVAKTNAEVSR